MLTALLEYINLFIKIEKTVTHYALCFGMPIMLKLCRHNQLRPSNGAVGNHWFQWKWPDNWKETNIMAKELVAIIISCVVWDPELAYLSSVTT